MRILWAMVLIAGPAFADGKLDGAAITLALTGKTLSYDDGTRQIFKPDGGTIFDNGQQSLGHWAVRGDQYCSVWPPSDHWACYDVTMAAAAISFVAADGKATVGHVAE